MNVITIARQPRGKGLRSKKAKRRKKGGGGNPRTILKGLTRPPEISTRANSLLRTIWCAAAYSCCGATGFAARMRYGARFRSAIWRSGGAA
jgi:hypothetical protein